jgi:transcriptional regulator with XRE-family HTH domain
MLGLTQADLAAKAGISKTALIAIETGTSDPKASTLSAIQKALEAAGVEFTNGEQPGVRLKGKAHAMTRGEFLDALRSFEHKRLLATGIHYAPENRPIFGFALVYDVGDTFADLMFVQKAIGRAKWNSGVVSFDPPLPIGRGATAFDDDLFEWASRAYHRSVTTG